MLNSLQAEDAVFAVTHDDWCSLEVRPSSSYSSSHYLQMEKLEDICDRNAVLQSSVRTKFSFSLFWLFTFLRKMGLLS